MWICLVAVGMATAGSALGSGVHSQASGSVRWEPASGTPLHFRLRFNPTSFRGGTWKAQPTKKCPADYLDFEVGDKRHTRVRYLRYLGIQ